MRRPLVILPIVLVLVLAGCSKSLTDDELKHYLMAETAKASPDMAAIRTAVVNCPQLGEPRTSATALWAIEHGQEQVLTFLFDAGLKPDADGTVHGGYVAAAIAADAPLSLEIVLKQGATLMGRTNEYLVLAVTRIGEKGELAVLERIVSSEAAFTPPDRPLIDAVVASGRREIAAMLEKKLDMAAAIAAIPESHVLVSTAIKAQQREMAKYLLERGALPQPAGKEAVALKDAVNRPLYLACASGDEELVRLLLSRGASFGCLAAVMKEVPAWIALILSGDPGLDDVLFLRVQVPASGGSSPAAGLFAGEPRLAPYKDLLHVIAAATTPSMALDSACVERLLSIPQAEKTTLAVSVGSKPARDYPIGIAAIMNGWKHFARHLVERGYSTRTKDPDGLTILMHAVKTDDRNFVELLLKSGADVNAEVQPRIEGSPDRAEGEELPHTWSALIVATLAANAPMVELLLARGANPDAKYRYTTWERLSEGNYREGASWHEAVFMSKSIVELAKESGNATIAAMIGKAAGK